MPTNTKQNYTVNTFIQMGMNGHYPLFQNQWINDLNLNPEAKLTEQDFSKVRSIIERLSSQKSLEKKRTLLFSLSHTERSIFIRAFYKLVETKILDERPMLH